ncbi:MAG TPA: TrkH family potassium uptake protein, partial [Methanothrix soehngenii]|nr:TrkH family potassium uptake protein [Methanothrix soehngenii]
MKYPIVLDVIGTVLKIMGLLLLVPGLVSAWYHESCEVVAFALTALLSIGSGIIMSRWGKKGEVGNKEAFAAVSLGWLAATFFGSLPFAFMGLSLVDSLFESISGFSATGATILVESNAQGYYILNSTLVDSSICAVLVKDLSLVMNAYGVAWQAAGTGTFYGLLFWRSFQQLIGG